MLCEITIKASKALVDSVTKRYSNYKKPLGTSHYLSPGRGAGGGGGDRRIGGNHLIFRRTEGGISRSRKPKKGDH